MNIGFGFLIRVSMATTIRQPFPAASGFDPRGVKESGRLGIAGSGGQKTGSPLSAAGFHMGSSWVSSNEIL